MDSLLAFVLFATLWVATFMWLRSLLHPKPGARAEARAAVARRAANGLTGADRPDRMNRGATPVDRS